MNPVEMAVVILAQVTGYIFGCLFRVFVITIILFPFFGLMAFARKEAGVRQVG